MRSLFVRIAAFCLFIAGLGSGIARAQSGPDNADFETLRAALLKAETTELCEQARRCWKNLTLEAALRAAPSQEEALVEADAVGLLRGFVALRLRGESCAPPPAEVLGEAQEYSRRFGWPASAPSDTLLAP